MKLNKFFFVLLCLLSVVPLQAQEILTGLQGKVVDAVTGESVPFVQIVFTGTTIGTTTDMEGKFRLTNDAGHTQVRFQMMGYEPVDMTLEKGKVLTRQTISMNPQAKVLGTVEVSAKRGRKTRYTRRNNPAVELVKKVIAHRDDNRMEAQPRWRRDVYEKLTLAFDDFRPDFVNNRWWRKVNFLEKYIDETPFDATPILTISMRERMSEQSYRLRPKQRRTLITARRMEGLDQMLGQEGLDADLEAMFMPFDIYDGDIQLMLNYFVGPLSPTLAVSFYRYYITDTVEVDGQRCVELSYVPANKESYGFTGQLYIALDSSYAVAKSVMTVSPHVNLNFVRDLTIIQTFELQANGLYIPVRSDSYGRLYIHRRVQELYAHHVRLYTKYDLSDEAPLLPDSLFTALSHEAQLPRATKVYRKEWNSRRPMELTYKETMLDSLKTELSRLPEFKVAKRVFEIGVSGYIPTAKEREKSPFDIGPIYNMVSHNHEEGWRVRLGGMTTSVLDSHHFAEGYVAYGFRDRRPKFNATYTYTFDAKNHHSHESPRSNLSFGISYDIETPGQSFDNIDRDNFMMSTDRARKVQYVGQALLRLRKEWRSHISLDTWVAVRQVEPAGMLVYTQILPDGTLCQVDRFADAEWHGSFSFSPNRNSDNMRPGNTSLFTLNQDAPNISLTHKVGYIEGGFFYQRTDFDADKRFWLGAFGHIDTKVKAGVVWNRVPYPRLYIPSGNDNLFLSKNAFNTMRPMEFIVDQYISLFLTYHLKGWILNRIPLINKLRFREVVGFNLLYGGLSSKNDPTVEPAGLYQFPVGTSPLGTTPYMEYSVGVENILKFIRVDYVRRLTYVDGIDPAKRGFIRIELRFTL